MVHNECVMGYKTESSSTYKGGNISEDITFAEVAFQETDIEIP